MTGSVFDNVSALAGTRYHRVLHNSDLMDASFLRKAREDGIRLPTGGNPERDKFWGAFVATPTAGRHGPVGYLDLASLYPNNIIMLNASPDTIIGGEAALTDSEYTEDAVVWGYYDPREIKQVGVDDDTPWQSYRNPERYKMIVEERASGRATKRWEDPEGPRYEKLYFLSPDVQQGFISDTVSEWIDEKYRYEGALYSAIKMITNSCFTPDTDVLTPDGIVSITDVEVGDMVYSWDADTGTLETKEVYDTIHKPNYDGELTNIQNNNVDLSVTPDHRLITRRSQHTDEYEVVDAGELDDYTHYELPNDWTGTHGSGVDTVDLLEYLDEYEVFVETAVHGRTFQSHLTTDPRYRQHETCSGGYVFDKEQFCEDKSVIEEYAGQQWVHVTQKQKWIPRFYDGDDVCELLGWFASEGSTYTSEEQEYKNTHRGVTHTFTISQYDQHGSHHDTVGELLDRMGLTYYEDDKCFTVASEAWATILRQWCGVDSASKRLPEWVFTDCSREQKQAVFDALMKGDGDTREVSNRYTTTSDDLRDDFVRLTWELGHGCNYTYEEGTDVWRCHVQNGERGQRSFRMHRDGSTDHAKNGVYCVQVEDNHTLVAGRNGTFNIVPNCYGYLGFTGSRLFDWRIAEAITLTGRLVIQHTIETAQQYIQDEYDTDTFIKMGDTDGAGIVLEDVPADDTQRAVDIYRDAARHVNDSYDAFCRDTFGVDDHTMEVEIESVADTVFVPAATPTDPSDDVGVKKRYAQRIRWDEGDWDTETSITGMDATRSDIASVTERLQREVVHELLDGTAPEALTDTVADAHKRARNGDMALGEVAKRQGVSQPLAEYGDQTRMAEQQARGAKYANEHIPDVHISEGDKVSLIYVDRLTDGLPQTYTAATGEDGNTVDVIAVNDTSQVPDGVIPDWEKHATKAIVEPLRDIFRTLGVPWDDVIRSDAQTGLSSF